MPWSGTMALDTADEETVMEQPDEETVMDQPDDLDTPRRRAMEVEVVAFMEQLRDAGVVVASEFTVDGPERAGDGEVVEAARGLHGWLAWPGDGV